MTIRTVGFSLLGIVTTAILVLLLLLPGYLARRDADAARREAERLHDVICRGEKRDIQNLEGLRAVAVELGVPITFEIDPPSPECAE